MWHCILEVRNIDIEVLNLFPIVLRVIALFCAWSFFLVKVLVFKTVTMENVSMIDWHGLAKSVWEISYDISTCSTARVNEEQTGYLKVKLFCSSFECLRKQCMCFVFFIKNSGGCQNFARWSAGAVQCRFYVNSKKSRVISALNHMFWLVHKW